MQAYDPEIGLHPPLLPFDHGFVEREGHSIYYEQCGRLGGIPVLFLHGGPGAGSVPVHRRLFDPKRYHFVLFDQRGCGRSRPFAELNNNTTKNLVEDIEALRRQLGISRFILFGGSWGVTLALAYAVRYPEHCLGFVLRGVFLGSRKEINWFLYDMGRFFPEAYDRFISHIPPLDRDDLLTAYYRRLTSPSKSVAMSAANHWAAYENSCVTLAAIMRDAGSSSLTLSLLEAHYFISDCFLPPDYLLDNLGKIKHLPAYIIQGRYDIICPPFTAHRLAQAWGINAQLRLVDDAGHSAFEVGVVSRLMRCLGDLASDLSLKGNND